MNDTVRPYLEDAIELAIAQARMDAKMIDEPVTITACVGLSICGPGGPEANCPMCETIWVYPTGKVTRERRRN